MSFNFLILDVNEQFEYLISELGIFTIFMTAARFGNWKHLYSIYLFCIYFAFILFLFCFRITAWRTALLGKFCNYQIWG